MAGGAQKSEQTPEAVPKSSSEPQPATSPVQSDMGQLIVRKLSALLIKLVGNATDWKTVAVLVVGFLGYVYMLPASERKNISVLRFVELTLGNPGKFLVSMGGWVLLLVVLVVGGAWVIVASRRLQAQGEELSARHQQRDPHRLSSRDADQLKAYARRTIERPADGTTFESLRPAGEDDAAPSQVESSEQAERRST